MPAEERRPAEKAAAVISMLGTERASEVFRYLTENEVEQLSMEITRLPHLAPDEMRAEKTMPRKCWKKHLASSRPEI